MYSKEFFRTKPCVNEKRGKKCEYLVICPFRHADDIVDFEDKMCYSKTTLDFITNSIKFNTDKILDNIKTLQTVVDFHLCNQCDGELKKSYNIVKCCVKVLCNECANKKPFCCGKEVDCDNIIIK